MQYHVYYFARRALRVSLLLLVASVVGRSSAFDLVIDGEPVAVVVVPDYPFPSVEYAAEELQHHVRQASGAELPIVREGDLAGDVTPRVYLGSCEATKAAGLDLETLAPDSFRARLTEAGLFIFGDDADGDPLADGVNGTLFGVYDFLEQHLGVRWVWPGALGEVIPARATIRVERWRRDGSPVLGLSTWRIIPRHEHWPDPAAGEAFTRDQAVWKKRMGFTITYDFRPSHNFPDYWVRFGRSNPEFFSLLPDGKRAPLAGDPAGTYVTLCVSEPGLWEQAIRDWETAGRPPVLKVGENDTPGMCTCERCRAWDAPDWRFYTSPYWAGGQVPSRFTRFAAESGLAGDSAAWGGVFRLNNAPSLSDRYARFYARVQEHARELEPDVIVAGYGYANYWRAPKETRLHDQILISFVPPLWYPYTERMSRDARREWDGWRATGARVMFRPNLTHAGHAFPIQYGRPLMRDIRYFHRTGAVGMHFDLLIGSWATQGPTYYALGRAVHRPDLTPEQIMGEYYAAFGPASAAVQHYFDHWRSVGAALDEDAMNLFHYEAGGAGGHRNWVLIADRVFTPEVMAEGRRRLTAAGKAAHGDTKALARVVFLDQGLTHAERVLEALRAHKADRVDEVRLAEAFRRLHDYRLEIQGNGVADLGYLRRHEPASWRELDDEKPTE